MLFQEPQIPENLEWPKRVSSRWAFKAVIPEINNASKKIFFIAIKILEFEWKKLWFNRQGFEPMVAWTVLEKFKNYSGFPTAMNCSARTLCNGVYSVDSHRNELQCTYLV